MSHIDDTLGEAAYVLANEIHDGCWSHVLDLELKPAPACTELIDELRRRCPGYSIPDYQKALAEGLFASR